MTRLTFAQARLEQFASDLSLSCNFSNAQFLKHLGSYAHKQADYYCGYKGYKFCFALLQVGVLSVLQHHLIK